MFLRYLEPMHYNQKSFYHKAYESMEENEVRLYSYGTHIATYNQLEGCGYVIDAPRWNSQTSIRHINEFFMQRGMARKLAKKEYTPGKNIWVLSVK